VKYLKFESWFLHIKYDIFINRVNRTTAIYQLFKKSKKVNFYFYWSLKSLVLQVLHTCKFCHTCRHFAVICYQHRCVSLFADSSFSVINNLELYYLMYFINLNEWLSFLVNKKKISLIPKSFLIWYILHYSYHLKITSRLKNLHKWKWENSIFVC
jgi:hypothetical protein